MFPFQRLFGDEMQNPIRFTETYRCFSVSMMHIERDDLEKGGKIILPQSALDQLTRLNVQYPMLFKLTNKKDNVDRQTHCGVLEFIADEGHMHVPHWMMKNLYLEEGETCQIENVSLPIATFAKFQPQSLEFLDLTNPKAVLEHRHFACLTAGDVIAIYYNDKVYELCVLETKPGNAVSIIECDMNVDFASPVGYQEHQRKEETREESTDDLPESEILDPGFCAFQGQGHRIDGKEKNTQAAPQKTTANGRQRGIPNYNHDVYNLHFSRDKRRNKEETSQDAADTRDFKAFQGEGQSLRQKIK
ncbi:DgyrCDS10595 [Dimorphilus gyrociliatus]|uniref:DgyrCDS10595 n=1 Tax=Dimorphilus gyrociliatus TaxID=2664684 RepID=A0A7I8W2N9_9ANNE|nr:DgyrCDS10595 [Dimorphilus gyrociliatus]